MSFEKHILITKMLIKGDWIDGELEIPVRTRAAVARGTAILDVYTNFALGKYEETRYKYVVPNPDDGYSILNAYVYGAIQLAEDFGTTDFHNYYSEWVDEVILPAIFKCNDEYIKENFGKDYC